MKTAYIALALLALVGTASAWEQAEQDKVIAGLVEAGFPPLKAFKRLTPKMLSLVMKNYGNALAPGAFEYLSPPDLEVIFAAVSASNNCEMCLSFHMMTLGNPESPTGSNMHAKDIKLIAAGGIPVDDERAANLVTASKYALAHKGIYLEREQKHLATLGFDSEDYLLEINYAVGIMAGMNSVYISMIANGLDLEDFLKTAGPFQDTVYAGMKKEL